MTRRHPAFTLRRLLASCSVGLAVIAAAPAFAHNHGSAKADADTKAAYEKRPDIVDTAVSAGQFNTLVAAVKAAGLVETLKGDGPFTVFAPTDAAFAKLPEGTLEALLEPENRDKLQAILLYHVVAGNVKAADAVKLDAAPTMLGQPAAISTEDYVSIAGSRIDKTDIAASNGVIHIIDSVMMPLNIVEVAASTKQFGTLLAAAQAAGLAETLAEGGPFTVFAPTDAAFAKLPEGTVQSLLKAENREQLRAILLHHVVAGRVNAEQVVGMTYADTLGGTSLTIRVDEDTVHIDNATVIATNVGALNGVVHVIDTVMLPDAR